MKTESKATHTPGPWSERKWNCDEHQVSAIGGTIALVSHTHSLVPDEQADANARLISAAPELLAACELLLGRLDEDEDRNAKWIGDTARAAIAKALGHE